jgi:hypothetical protein
MPAIDFTKNVIILSSAVSFKHSKNITAIKLQLEKDNKFIAR